jgi:hypothetical protein
MGMRLQVRDLLSKDPKNKLEVKEHKDNGVYVKGLNAFVVKGVPELNNVLEVRASRKKGRAHTFTHTGISAAQRDLERPDVCRIAALAVVFCRWMLTGIGTHTID